MAKQRPEVVNEVPDNAADMGAAKTEEGPGKQVSIFATLPAWQPHPTLAEIAKMQVEASALLAASDLSKTTDYKAVKAYKMSITRKRTSVDARRKEEGREALEYKRNVDAAGNLIMARLEEIEEPLEAALKAQDAKEVEEALAEAKRIEAEQRAKEDQRLALLAAEEQRRKDAEAAVLKAKEDELAAQRAAIEEEKAQFAAQRAEFDRQQAELRAQQEQQRLENERAQREAQKKIDDERRAKEEKERQAEEKRQAEIRAKEESERAMERQKQREQERIANEKRIEEAKKAAAELAVKNEQARVAREAEAAKAKAEKERLAAEKAATKAPDLVKVKAWRTKLIEVIDTAPNCKDLEAIQVVGRVKKELIAVDTIIKLFVEAK